ncbi:proteasome regulatory particle base subunit [Malassezia pachydermatis]|uniref:26S proteasome regulatory subunit RPN1 n=1 Tax=Malassezia pachydermatis TaxID=77020 RepID=A0A0M9VNL2_9BASI|nr:26s proteasome regulatory complex non-atpase subcomplex rpn1 subunit [Malassezia pachydermatis]KOS13469.1 26s proteasome regulatory complex non-atpase subcomplex rpn1 subunit [Malassezia pachydermatis]
MVRDESQAASIRVLSRDPEKPEETEPKHAKNEKHATSEPQDNEMSEEDKQLKGELDMLVERLQEGDTKLYRPALEVMRNLIRTSTSSMTSVPKPLKFLHPHYPDLKKVYESWSSANEDKVLFAEILSVLAMTYSNTGDRETLRFRLRADEMRTSTTAEDLGHWGHEYVRHLCTELGEEYNARTEKEEDASELMRLALLVVQFSLQHNAEVDAVDLLLEMEAVDQLPQYVDKDTYERVCLYLVSCVNLLVPPDDVMFLRTARVIYRKHQRFFEALVLSVRLMDRALIREDFTSTSNKVMQKQMAFLLARQQIPLEWLQDESAPIEDQELLDCLFHTHLSSHFIDFGKELSVYDPKTPEDVYKTHLETARTTMIDSARGNLANVFVNAFVNAGFGNDPLMVGADEGDSYVYKTKDHGKLSAAASTGVSLLWDTEMGLSHIDKYTYSSEEQVKAGAMLAYGLLHAGVRTEMDAPLALLSEHVESKSKPLQHASIVGLGMAYAGSAREEVLALLLPYVQDETVSMDTAALCALSLGFVFVGSAHGEIVPSLLQTMMEREPSQLDDKWMRFLALGLALLFLGRQDESDATIETLKAIEHASSRDVQILVDACSYAGTGNVLKIQTLLHYCAEHVTPAKKESEEGDDGEEVEAETVHDLYQAFSVLAIALIAMGEDVGADMTLRHMSHLMHYGDPVIRRTVPLAMALLHPSNPAVGVLDTLSKYSHDSDLDVALNAIFAMGIVGAGTNNARLAQRLRQLASYYAKEPDCLFVVRIAQGLVHMGKGTLGLDPYHTDRLLFSYTGVAGLLATLLAFTEARGFVLDRTHWMLYWLVSAMRPRFLITLDESLAKLPVNVRVGKAVDVVGQAGKPRTISGFQTHTTPVRLGARERGVLATEEYLSYAPIMEGFVILHKNPGLTTDA